MSPKILTRHGVGNPASHHIPVTPERQSMSSHDVLRGIEWANRAYVARHLRHRVHILHIASCRGCQQFRRMALLAPAVRRTEVGPRWLG